MGNFCSKVDTRVTPPPSPRAAVQREVVIRQRGDAPQQPPVPALRPAEAAAVTPTPALPAGAGGLVTAFETPVTPQVQQNIQAAPQNPVLVGIHPWPGGGNAQRQQAAPATAPVGGLFGRQGEVNPGALFRLTEGAQATGPLPPRDISVQASQGGSSLPPAPATPSIVRDSRAPSPAGTETTMHSAVSSPRR